MCFEMRILLGMTYTVEAEILLRRVDRVRHECPGRNQPHDAPIESIVGLWLGCSGLHQIPTGAVFANHQPLGIWKSAPLADLKQGRAVIPAPFHGTRETDCPRLSAF